MCSKINEQKIFKLDLSFFFFYKFLLFHANSCFVLKKHFLMKGDDKLNIDTLDR